MTMAGPERFEPPRSRSVVERALSLVTDVRAGEGGTAVLLAANIFCIIAFYSVLKVVRDALILAESGAEVASYAAAGQALILLAVVPLYGAVASSVNRVRLVCGVTAFFASHLVVFYLLGAAGTRIGVVFYLWAGVFNLVVTAQFWAFANDVYTSERGRRLFPIVGLGASLGAVVGAGLTFLGFEQVGAYRLMLVAAIGLLVPVGLTLWINTRERRQPTDPLDGTDGSRTAATRQEAPLARTGGFQLIFEQRYLMLIALLMVFVNLVNTLGGFLLNTIIITEATTLVSSGAAPGLEVREVAGTLSAGIQTWVNTLGLLFQALLVSRIFKYLGVRGALFILPVIAVGGYAAVALFPLVGVVKLVKILENSTDYSIQNTTRNALFLPTSREAKYKAKQAIDSFFWRAGDLLQAGVVWVGANVLALTLRSYALLNVAFALALLGIVVMLFREHKKVTAGVVEERAA